LTPTEEEYAARVKALKYSDIKRIKETDNDLFSYQVTSAKDRETKYLVFKSQVLGWTCTCKDFQYRSDPTNNEYQCKHIKRVIAMIEESAKRQFNKAKKELSN
jgi:SWIM zinc finger